MTGHGINGEYYDLQEALFVTNTYRLFGHDVNMFDAVTRKNIMPWANARECVIEAASIDFSPAREKRLAFYSNVPREGRTHVLPYISTLVGGEPFTVAYHRPSIVLNAWHSRLVPLRPHVVTARVKASTKFFVQAPMTYRPVLFTAKPVKKQKPAGFREQPGVETPSVPEQLKIRHQADANAYTEPSAEDVLYAGSNEKLNQPSGSAPVP